MQSTTATTNGFHSQQNAKINAKLAQINGNHHQQQHTTNGNGHTGDKWSHFEESYAKEFLIDGQFSQSKASEFLTEIFHLLLEVFDQMKNRNTKVLEFRHPAEMKKIWGQNIKVPQDPVDLAQLLQDCRETIRYSMKTGHPRFCNQLFGGLDVVGVAGEMLTAVLNASVYTYEVGTIFTLMEEECLNEMRKAIGWSNDGRDGDGITAPGGTMSNLYAVLLARQAKLPDVKQTGLCGRQPVALFTSRSAHYSIKQAAVVSGIGLDNVYLVDTDERGCMRMEHLEDQIKTAKLEGKIPCMVVATAGTTVLGAFDDIEGSAKLCKQYNLWLHVDGAWGGGVIMSKKHRHLVKGIEDANSVTWNPHKIMGTPQQCSVILLREKGQLDECNSLKAAYLFQKDKFYDVSYDTGDKSYQCGRRNDIFKLWLMWRSKGSDGFEKLVDKYMDLASYLYDQLGKHDGFKIAQENPQFVNICFWYVPKSLRHITNKEDFHQAMHKVTSRIKCRMMEKGSFMICYQPIDDKPNFFRMVFVNNGTEKSDIDFLLKEISSVGEEIAQSD